MMMKDINAPIAENEFVADSLENLAKTRPESEAHILQGAAVIYRTIPSKNKVLIVENENVNQAATRII